MAFEDVSWFVLFLLNYPRSIENDLLGKNRKIFIAPYT
jgi:hypothetical protein